MVVRGWLSTSIGHHRHDVDAPFRVTSATRSYLPGSYWGYKGAPSTHDLFAGQVNFACKNDTYMTAGARIVSNDVNRVRCGRGILE